MPTTQLKI